MTPPFAILLMVGAIGIFALTLKKISRSEIAVADSVFWFFFALSLVVLAVFPRIAFVIADALGFQSVVNFVFLYVIAVLLIKVFYMTAEIARLRTRQAELVQGKALTDLEAGRFGRFGHAGGVGGVAGAGGIVHTGESIDAGENDDAGGIVHADGIADAGSGDSGRAGGVAHVGAMVFDDEPAVSTGGMRR